MEAVKGNLRGEFTGGGVPDVGVVPHQHGARRRHCPVGEGVVVQVRVVELVRHELHCYRLLAPGRLLSFYESQVVSTSGDKPIIAANTARQPSDRQG